MNPAEAVFQDKLKKMIEDIIAEKAASGRTREDVVRRGEFNILLGVCAFALTAILGGFTFLHTKLTDLHVALDKGGADLRVSMEKDLTDLRVSMKKDLADLRVSMEKDLADLRVTMEKDIADLRVTMEKEHADLRSDIKELRSGLTDLGERVERVETILGK